MTTNIKSNRISMFDVDGTLVRWLFDISDEEYQKLKEFEANNDGAFPDGYLEVHQNSMGKILLKENKEVTNLLKHQSLAGATIIVWSASGTEWADKIVKALKLEEFVTITMCKPTWYTDDLQSHEWMGHWNKVDEAGKLVHACAGKPRE